MNTIAIIGGGPAGYVAAITAARQGARVILIEAMALGGTCLNEGCMPTKSLLESTEMYERVKRAADFGIEILGGEVRINWKRIQKYKDKTVKKLVLGIQYLMKKNQIEVIQGMATFINNYKLQVHTKEGVQDIEAERYIIATGSEPIALPFAPFDGEWILNSTHALEQPYLPKSILIVGGGVIGCEFASIYSRLGCEVTIVEMADSILPGEDEDIAAILAKQLQSDGVTLHTAAAVQQLDKAKKSVVIQTKDEQIEVQAERVLVAVGRKPRMAQLGLENTSVIWTERGIEVSDNMSTSVPHIYACGDVIGGIQLAHLAFHEGEVAGANACGGSHQAHSYTIPRCIYTWPEVASVGLTERQARQQYGDIRVSEFPFSANGKALILQEQIGKVKVITEPVFQEILGISIVGPRATELIGQGTLMIHGEMTVDTLDDFIAAHPTLAEAIHEAVRAAKGAAVHI
ncbi:dihydrolipoyl dehydrogenase [Aneurinibacillus aneurinilyticus]|uniref:Dihydrolipoyl dehydrogenase n=1 Tax=Aneurinibacillus aneurinilyticus ATCC 12856 TaxID=649747 RepID=U1YCN0_ANEAE|nr:dihydrolipoyl dehydrogenase [Aneurinibacillus aneurinilyticus]ERI09847.1 dihydrolipoyl dehydrogenase [Aneurinibacillus aneurinilyticus ATCC 12856]MED0707998.1 dihydrolipoyl dehydrogenase [Aneurinibacillus aneurinilyticus]MED0722161.1 dihydrolipoyl dehydrogenase [Aneurinibacillus aneurinilyticus]MED0734321.1 dihydrolipoyl dehydrogenase [Aneurinibacillus aneurinilyticus]MED0741897.1 dihydrolipoyl dehydrogenase [Aneurinibacillus aneurinilyticus]